MNQQPKAKMFLADERGSNETSWFRSYNTFNFGKYFNEHKYSFGDLYALNDETIAGGHSATLRVGENSYLLLLPVVGAIACKVNCGNEIIVNAGQLQILYLQENDTVEVLNYNENELINFIQVLIKATTVSDNNENRLFNFNIDGDKNQLINITGSVTANAKYPIVSIGKFTGRGEAVYELKNEQNNLFVFVIEGVFEVHGRLVHARDGLALWSRSTDIEMEALSNDAIVFMIELNE